MFPPCSMPSFLTIYRLSWRLWAAQVPIGIIREANHLPMRQCLAGDPTGTIILEGRGAAEWVGEGVDEAVRIVGEERSAGEPCVTCASRPRAS